MADLETIQKIARKTLTVPSISGDPDNWLWDRTLRILQNTEHICRLPELAERAMAIDRFCLVGAVYFADSGRVRPPKGSKTSKLGLSGDIPNVELCDLSTQAVSDTLAGVISEKRIDKINTIITESVNRFTDVTEAMILSDARGLEELGTAGLLGRLREDIMHGKGASETLESWKRKIEYGYWQARLKESFRFAAVRQIAERRFAAVEAFMNQLAVEQTAEDLKEQLTQMLKKK